MQQSSGRWKIAQLKFETAGEFGTVTEESSISWTNSPFASLPDLPLSCMQRHEKHSRCLNRQRHGKIITHNPSSIPPSRVTFLSTAADEQQPEHLPIWSLPGLQPLTLWWMTLPITLHDNSKQDTLLRRVSSFSQALRYNRRKSLSSQRKASC